MSSLSIRLALLSMGLTCLLLGSSCIPLRAFLLGGPDKKDLYRFKYKTVKASDDCFKFHSTKEKQAPILINDWTSDVPVFKPLELLLSGHETRSCLVIQRDSIRFRYNRSDIATEDLHSSYSIAKSFTSALIGIAIAEGHIKGMDEKVKSFFPELDLRAPEWEQLSIRHLLNHTSGIKYTLPLDATIYYGNKMDKCFKLIEFERAPGKEQHYLNANIQLLGYILERATNRSPAAYLEEKIWQPAGMCHDARWSTDHSGTTEKTFCCLGATIDDYAKFGRLFLHQGNWNGKQLISKDWYEQSISRDTTEGSSYNYTNSWHIGLKEYGDFMAIGLYKQHIYVHPEKEVIIVLLNDKENKLKAERVNWWYVFRQIVDQL